MKEQYFIDNKWEKGFLDQDECPGEYYYFLSELNKPNR